LKLVLRRRYAGGMNRGNFTSAALAGILLATAPTVGRAEDFAIKDGDTVVFLGDSITAARAYGKLIENYTLLRFPKHRVRFINTGIGGDTAAGGLKRLERDVFARHATLLTVAYGINDIGWGAWADEAHKRTYLDAVRGIVLACKEHGVRVYLCSAAITRADPNKSENDFLQQMCDAGMKLARELGGGAIDVQRTMRSIQKKVWQANAGALDKSKRSTLHADDGIHLNDLGQLAMGFAILKGLGAPADVSSVRLDAREPRVLQAVGCRVTDLARRGDALEFTRLDEGLPLNNGLFFALHFRFVPIPDELNRYLLAADYLPEGRYEVTADGRGVGTFTARELAAGVNIASTTPDPWQPGGPWNAQANVLKELTDARHQVATAQGLAGYYLQGSATAHLFDEPAAKSDAQIVAMQRAIAAPRPYRFVIRPAPPPKPPKSNP
jgi:lysophospholipase L1-like esterase